MKRHFYAYLIILGTLQATHITLYAQGNLADKYNATFITMNEGLGNNFVDDLYKDSRGFLWVSMGGGGLARYDGYEFLPFHAGTPSCPLKSNFILNVCEDSFQRLWVVSEGGTDIIDLNTLQSQIPTDHHGRLADLLKHPATFVTRDALGCIWFYCNMQLHRIAFNSSGEVDNISSLSLPALKSSFLMFKDVEQEGSVWMGINGRIYKIAVNQQGALQESPIADCQNFNSSIFFSDFLTLGDDVWISSDMGLHRYHRPTQTVHTYLHQADNPHSISQNYITALGVTEEHHLLASSLRGINIYHPEEERFERIESRPDAGTSLLNSNFVNCLIVDGKHIWIGTESGGINKWSTKRLAVQNYRYNKENPASLSPNPVNAIYEDKDGNLWVGTVEGGLNYQQAEGGEFHHYTTRNSGLCHNSVSAITADGNDRLWVGTWGGGITVFDRRRPLQPLMYLHADSSGHLPINFVGTLTYDAINNGMWIGCNQGLYYYDLNENRLLSPLTGNASTNLRGCIGSIIDRDDQLWIGCLEGVYIIDLHSAKGKAPDEAFLYRHLKYKLDDPASELIEKITCFCETEDGTLWLGSNGYGIYRRTTDADGKEHFTNYNTAHGLPSNSIRGIVPGKEKALWIATNNGLSRFVPQSGLFTTYTLQDGLGNAQFYWNASTVSSTGKLYFGHVEGLTVVSDRLPTPTPQAVHVRFTRLKVNNEEVFAGSELLPHDIAVTRRLVLHERLKSFSLEFSALNYEPENGGTYCYRLKGFDSQWIQASGNRRFARYTNLSPGNYTLQVKYQPTGSTAEGEVTEIDITVRPYFYRTIWFILSVTAIALLFIWQFFVWRIRSFKHQQVILRRKVEERTHQLNEQKKLLEEMTLDKIAFFTNITHEFRTPITLIIGPIERALKLSYNPQVIEQLHFVERNSRYLLSLVNQLMDFRKVETGNVRIVKSLNNLEKFADELLVPFEAFARERRITIRRCFRLPNPEMYYDEEAMNKVLTNLLSNAIKFTPDEGIVTVYLATLPANAEHPESLYLCVSDTGCGIPDENLAHIFDRFYQAPGQTKYPVYGQSSSGIGLYLCKNIIQLHGGKISAVNNPTRGSSFRILLPLTQEQVTPQPLAEEISPSPATLIHSSGQPAITGSQTTGKQRLCILVVEDNADMRAYIRSILKEKYDILEASEGAEALELLGAHSIDFIISDLMMPVMDGIELSRRVKENLSTSHIPFLMLTAKTSQGTRIESYRIGVDEYLLKPFDETLLLTRIENILENRKRARQQFAMNMDVEALNIEEKSGDHKLLERIMKVVKENYKNSEFEVTDFCEAVGISKTLLNQKLQSLTGQSAGQFIRSYRLNLAHALLLKSRESKSMTIAEIAYEVGFNDPKYFARCFVKQYNITPSALMNGDKKEA